MLNVDTIKNGLVIDHICAGSGPKIFHWLGLEKAKFTAALVMNVPSKTMERKDIIKVDNIINIDFSVLGFIDPNITVNVVKDEKIVKKIKMELPSCVENVRKCKTHAASQQQNIMFHSAFSSLIKKKRFIAVNTAMPFTKQVLRQKSKIFLKNRQINPRTTSQKTFS